MRFLNMSEAGHDGLSDGDFLNCIFFQVEQLVADGWHSFLLMIRYSVQVLTNLAFQVQSHSCLVSTHGMPWLLPVTVLWMFSSHNWAGVGLVP
jgi:hypothetical protein